MTAFGDEPSSYAGGNSPRSKLGDGAYTSTEYPAELEITPHPELCYGSSWPMRLYFACAEPATSGGATPLVDLRDLLARLDPALVARFVDRGVVYIRRLHGGRGLGRSWQETFETDDRAGVEALLRADGARFEWREDGALTIRQRGPVVCHHPITGDTVWFNQVEQWHPSALPAFVRETVGAELPHDARFGDGGEIAEQDVAEVRRALWSGAGQFRWERGDLLVVDNHRLAHGRRSFRGPRRILVSMAVARPHIIEEGHDRYVEGTTAL